MSSVVMRMTRTMMTITKLIITPAIARPYETFPSSLAFLGFFTAKLLATTGHKHTYVHTVIVHNRENDRLVKLLLIVTSLLSFLQNTKLTVTLRYFRIMYSVNRYITLRYDTIRYGRAYVYVRSKADGRASLI